MQVITPALAPLLALLAAAPPPLQEPGGDAGDSATVELQPTQALRTTPEVDVVRRASPAVVYIEAHHAVIQTFRNGQPVYGTQTISGSGAVLDPSGYVITNFHVIGRDPRRITVEFDADLDLTVYEAQVVNVAPQEDLALLKIEGQREFPVLTRGTSSDLMLGERVIAIGNPLRQRLSVSSGIISGLHRNVTFGNSYTFRDLIQTDAAINPGNSGGPLLNVLGEMVGLTTVVNEGAQNMGFAIPVDRVNEVYDDVLLVPSVARAWFGMEIDETCEFAVVALAPGGPAQVAGVLPGDRLLGIDGREVADSQSYRAALLAVEPEQETELVFARARADGESERFARTLQGWTRIAGVLHERAGLGVDQVYLSGLHARVRVRSVQPGSPAAELGLRQADVLDSLRVPGGRTWIVDTPRNLARIVAFLSPGSVLELDVRRDADGNGRLTEDEFLRGTLRLR